MLIEHGNRFDEWNAVPHGALRRVRSQLSRALPAKPEFPALPGSRLVVDVMNPLKQQYAFIDLLKPEDAGACRSLRHLGPAAYARFGSSSRSIARPGPSTSMRTSEPLDQEYIGAGDQSDQQMFDLAQDIASGTDAAQVSAVGDFLKGVAGTVTDKVHQARRDALYKAIRGSIGKRRDAFDVDKELDTIYSPRAPQWRRDFKSWSMDTHTSPNALDSARLARPCSVMNTDFDAFFFFVQLRLVLLEAHGYQTVGTRNGIEALDLARKHNPDLILMDIQLPEVSGLEVTKWLKDDPSLNPFRSWPSPLSR